MAAVRRLRPKTHEALSDQLRLVLELPIGLRPETRDELTEALSTYSPEPWAFVMVGREASRIILREIVNGPRPGVTLAVWEAARLCSAYGSGEIEASREDLAQLAGTNEREVSRAMSRLVQIGALICLSRGRYALHPQAAWAGTQASRRSAKARLAPVE